MKRYLFAMALVATLLLVIPEVAAQPNYDEEFQAIRTLIDQALRLYREGRVEDAYKAARSAYLDHYEILETPLRNLDADHVFEMEVLFAKFRNAIRNEEPVEVVEALARDIQRGLDYDEGLLMGSPGEAYGITLVLSFSLIFREGLEAALLVGAILGYLQVRNQPQLKRHVYVGALLALVASLATYAVLVLIISYTATQRGLVEAIISFLAVVILFQVTFWLLRRIEHRRWMEFIRAKVWYALSTGSILALGGLTFLVIYREGLETVLLYQALLFITRGLEIYVLLGFLLGLTALAGTMVAINLLAARVPLKAFFAFTATVAAFLSVALVGHGVRELQSLDYVSLTAVDWVPALSPILADLTGIRPTLETLLAQAALILVYVLGGLYIFVFRPAAERALMRLSEAVVDESGPQGGPSPDGIVDKLEEPREGT
jgi:high-affinity iron transporter